MYYKDPLHVFSREEGTAPVRFYRLGLPRSTGPVGLAEMVEDWNFGRQGSDDPQGGGYRSFVPGPRHSFDSL